MSEANLRRRAKVLNELDERLSRPHPKPFRRTIVKKPQGFIVETGDVLRFPMMEERSANPYLALDRLADSDA
jgi:hypothetical protein